MKPPPFRYHDPRTIDEVVTLLDSLEDSKLLAGGQSLIPMLNMRLIFPTHVIDLNRTEGLASISRQDGQLVVGAMARQCDIARSEMIRSELPVLVEALTHVGHRQTRNRGTIGGSLAHLDPAAELVAVAMLLDATVSAKGPEGSRNIAFASFPLGYMTSSLGRAEALTAVSFQPWPADHGYSFLEFSRRRGDFAILSAGALVSCDPEGLLTKVAVVIGGAAEVPIRMSQVEAELVGQRPEPSRIEKACKACSLIPALGDALVPAAYRQHLAPILARRALLTAISRMEQRP